MVRSAVRPTHFRRYDMDYLVPLIAVMIFAGFGYLIYTRITKEKPPTPKLTDEEMAEFMERFKDRGFFKPDAVDETKD
jgi:hypothetical protein